MDKSIQSYKVTNKQELLQKRLTEIGEIKTHSVLANPNVNYKTSLSYEQLNIRNQDISKSIRQEFDRIPAAEPLTKLAGGDKVKNLDYTFQNIREGLVLLNINGRRLTEEELKSFNGKTPDGVIEGAFFFPEAKQYIDIKTALTNIDSLLLRTAKPIYETSQIVKVLPDIGLLSQIEQNKFFEILTKLRPDHFLKNDQNEFVVFTKNDNFIIPALRSRTFEAVNSIKAKIESRNEVISILQEAENPGVIEKKEGEILIQTYKEIGPSVLDILKDL